MQARFSQSGFQGGRCRAGNSTRLFSDPAFSLADSQSCLQQWLQQQPTCPTCRADLLPKRAPDERSTGYFIDMLLRGIAMLAPGPGLLSDEDMAAGVAQLRATFPQYPEAVLRANLDETQSVQVGARFFGFFFPLFVCRSFV